MAGTTWAALANNELVCHDEVVNAVATGQLMWATTNPGLAGGYCYTRADYATHIRHNSTTLAASGLATNEYMSKSEMVAHRVLAAILSTTPQATDLGSAWRASVQFNHIGAESVRVETRINTGSYSQLQILDTSPAGGTGLTSQVTVNDGSYITFRFTPYTGDNATGTAGVAVTQEVNEGHI